MQARYGWQSSSSRSEWRPNQSQVSAADEAWGDEQAETIALMAEEEQLRQHELAAQMSEELAAIAQLDAEIAETARNQAHQLAETARNQAHMFKCGVTYSAEHFE
jgi:hypothetical protein